MCPFFFVPAIPFIISLDTCNSSMTGLPALSLARASIRTQVQRTESTLSSSGRRWFVRGHWLAYRIVGKAEETDWDFENGFESHTAEPGYQGNYCHVYNQEAPCQTQRLVLQLPAPEPCLHSHNQEASLIGKTWRLANSWDERRPWLWNHCRKP